MKRATHWVLVLGSVALLIPRAVSAEEPPSLSHNPFSRPPSEVTAMVVPWVNGRDSVSLPLDLQATLVGGQDNLANVAGQIIRQGEEIQGHRLVKVYEDRAVFVREGKSLTVYVKPNLVDEDD